jgi:hypothetical protein
MEKMCIYELEEKLDSASKLHTELWRLNLEMAEHLTELDIPSSGGLFQCL